MDRSRIVLKPSEFLLDRMTAKYPAKEYLDIDDIDPERRMSLSQDIIDHLNRVHGAIWLRNSGTQAVFGDDACRVMQMMGSFFRNYTLTRSVTLNPIRLGRRALGVDSELRSLNNMTNFMPVEELRAHGISIQEFRRHSLFRMFDVIDGQSAKYAQVLGLSKMPLRTANPLLSYVEICWDLPYTEDAFQRLVRAFMARGAALKKSVAINRYEKGRTSYAIEFLKSLRVVLYRKTVETMRVEVRVRENKLKTLHGGTEYRLQDAGKFEHEMQELAARLCTEYLGAIVDLANSFIGFWYEIASKVSSVSPKPPERLWTRPMGHPQALAPP